MIFLVKSFSDRRYIILENMGVEKVRISLDLERIMKVSLARL